jgi:hypothetical protein
MCEVIRTKWSKLEPTLVHNLLTDFPKCGIKYTGKYSAGLVLVKQASDITMAKIVEKAQAANSEKSYFFMIPQQVAEAMNI